MKTKLVKLKDLKPGDIIKSYSNGEIVFKRVTDVWDTVVEKEKQVDLLFKNGTSICCSENHPIMVKSGSITEQKYPLDLSPKDIIITDSGETRLESITKGNHSEHYIDITVEDTNVFFAKTSDSPEMVLTHNCSQGGIRGGAATLYYPIWHLEVENLLVLKNNKGIDENRIRHLDYGVQINNLMIERLLNNEYITLFSPDVYQGSLYENYFKDQDEFKRMYELAENDKSLTKKRIKAIDLFSMLLTERMNTGRIYPYFVDNVGNQGPFIRDKATVKQSNLCLSGDSLVDIILDGEPTQVTMKELNNLFGKHEISVKSYDAKTDNILYKPVVNSALMNKSARVMKITYEGHEIICTPEHKIFTKNRGWVKAKDLTTTDQLVLSK